MSWRPDCIFEIHQLWQSGFSRVYSNCFCSCSFEPEIIKIGQSSHKMYSNNILNFQESTTILNTCTKKSGNLLNTPCSWSIVGNHTGSTTSRLSGAGVNYNEAVFYTPQISSMRAQLLIDVSVILRNPIFFFLARGSCHSSGLIVNRIDRVRLAMIQYFKLFELYPIVRLIWVRYICNVLLKRNNVYSWSVHPLWISDKSSNLAKGNPLRFPVQFVNTTLNKDQNRK